MSQFISAIEHGENDTIEGQRGIDLLPNQVDGLQ